MAKLLRRKHPNLDLFICDVFDAVPKDLKHQLEHPLFTLSKNADMNIKTHFAPNGVDYVKVSPSVHGLANIYDKDILIFAISQLMHKINRGEEPSQNIAFSAYDLLVATNRGTSGREYESLKKSFERLGGTRLETSLPVGDLRITRGFGLIESWEIVREGLDGRMEGLEIKLSDWMYEGILNTEVLTLSKDYFLISSPLEKRIYELCRKHCGSQKKWDISVEKFYVKTGSRSTLRRFKQALKKICDDNNIPDYKVKIKLKTKKGEEDQFVVTPKNTKKKKQSDAYHDPSAQTLINANKIINGCTDVYDLLEQYKTWVITLPEPPKKGYDAGFIGFVKKKVKEIEEHGLENVAAKIADQAIINDFVQGNPVITKNKTEHEIREMMVRGLEDPNQEESESTHEGSPMPDYISDLIHEDQGDLF